MKKRNYLSLIILLMTVTFVSCSNTEEKFNEAKKNGTIESYKKFISEYPDSKFTNTAKTIVDSLVFIYAKRENTEEAYISYYKEYPKSKFAKEALNKAASIAFENLKEKNVESAYLEFIKKYSGSDYEKEAKNKVSILKYQKAFEEYTIEAFQNFIADYPKSELVEEANKKIDDIKRGRKYWNEDEFAEKLRKANSKDYGALWKYKIKVIDGGNELTFKPDRRNGTIPLFSWEEKNIKMVNIGDLVVILHKEGVETHNEAGIGEIFFWHRSIMVFFYDKGTPKKLQDKLYKLHASKSKYQSKNHPGTPFSILCTFNSEVTN